MNILISGATGLFGSRLIEKMNRSCSFTARALKRDLVDFSSLLSTIENLALADTDILIHCAANTNVEICEEFPDESYMDNVLLTEVLVNACANSNTKFVFISSTGVYGEGNTSPFSELSHTNPTTVHHQCKLEAEKFVIDFAQSPLVIRTGWLFGGAISNKKNFVVNRIIEARQSNGVIYSNASQSGNPTFVDDLAEHVIFLVLDGRIGLYNCINEGVASRFEYVEAIIRFSGLDVKVESVSGKVFKRLAKVSSNESAINKKLTLFGINKMTNWRISLEKYIHDISDKL